MKHERIFEADDIVLDFAAARILCGVFQMPEKPLGMGPLEILLIEVCDADSE